MDAARPLHVGISIVPSAETLDRTRELVRVADEGGLQLVGIQDHPYQRRFLDTFALIATLLAQTRRISSFTDVANLPLRPPADMSKAPASLHVLSSGRFELDLGAGGFQDQIAGIGGPRRSPAESVEALDEAIEVIRLMPCGRAGACRRTSAPWGETSCGARPFGGSMAVASSRTIHVLRKPST
jgi:alkanesulfonate monooxygenase SsuD/methylene tetrahydromethanopterin reductase-like flavin-dependent oxidoreductase (luciferase family)